MSKLEEGLVLEVFDLLINVYNDKGGPVREDAEEIIDFVKDALLVDMD